MPGDYATELDEALSHFLDVLDGVGDEGTFREGYYTFVMKGNLALRCAVLGVFSEGQQGLSESQLQLRRSQKSSVCILTKPEIGGHRPIITTKPAIGEGRNDRYAQMELAAS